MAGYTIAIRIDSLKISLPLQLPPTEERSALLYELGPNVFRSYSGCDYLDCMIRITKETPSVSSKLPMMEM